MAGIIPLAQAAKLVRDLTPEEQLNSEELASIVNTVKNLEWTKTEVKEGRLLGKFSPERAAIVVAAAAQNGYDVQGEPDGARFGMTILRIRPAHLMPMPLTS